MRSNTGIATRFALLAMLAPLVAACTTTSNPIAAKPAEPTLIKMPSFPQFVRKDVDPAVANPCITAAANRYFIPERVVTAIDSRSGAGGNTDVILKVDSRDVLCSVSANGTVRSVVDTSPMSADQKAANEAARNATEAPQVASSKKTPAKKK